MNLSRIVMAARIFDVALLIILTAYILAGVALTPFHADEATQIHMSRDYAYQFLQGDLQRLRYDPDVPLTAETQLRLINGTLNKYLIGFAWHLAGYQESDLNTDWDWGGDWSYNVSAGHIPSDALLVVSRLPSALFAAAGVWIVFALGWQLGGRWTAYGAALYYTLSPGLLINGRRAMMEGTLTFFSLLTLLLGIWFLTSVWQRDARRCPLVAMILLAIAGGLTVASKHTGAVVVTAVFAACALALIVRGLLPIGPGLMQRLRAVAAGLIKLAAAGLLAVGVFFLCTPGWWGADLSRLLPTILQWRQELLIGQARDHNGYAETVANATGFARQVFLARPQYYEVREWRSIQEIADQITSYESSPWQGIALGGTPAGAGLLMLFVCTGIFALLRDPELHLAIRLPVGVWVLVVGVVVFVSPVEWQRYYLPLYPAVGLLAAYGPVGVARWWRKIRAERAARQAAQTAIAS